MSTTAARPPAPSRSEAPGERARSRRRRRRQPGPGPAGPARRGVSPRAAAPPRRAPPGPRGGAAAARRGPAAAAAPPSGQRGARWPSPALLPPLASAPPVPALSNLRRGKEPRARGAPGRPAGRPACLPACRPRSHRALLGKGKEGKQKGSFSLSLALKRPW